MGTLDPSFDPQAGHFSLKVFRQSSDMFTPREKAIRLSFFILIPLVLSLCHRLMHSCLDFLSSWDARKLEKCQRTMDEMLRDLKVNFICKQQGVTVRHVWMDACRTEIVTGESKNCCRNTIQKNAKRQNSLNGSSQNHWPRHPKKKRAPLQRRPP